MNWIFSSRERYTRPVIRQPIRRLIAANMAPCVAVLAVAAALTIISCSGKPATSARLTSYHVKKADSSSAPIDPNFEVTGSDLRTMVRDVPIQVQRTILAAPSSFLAAMASILHEPAIYFSLVDKRHALPVGYEPTDLIRLADYGLSVARNSVELRKAIMPEVTAMVQAARTDHVVLLFSSTYRSYETQKVVYASEVRLYGKKVADSESAVPGHSQHQMGTTVDFGCICTAFDKTPAFTWLTENAWKYGFSMTYPNGYEAITGYRYEPWHWHYITKAGALAQRIFFDNIQQYLLEFLHDNRAKLLSAYRGSDLGRGWQG